MWLTSVLKTLLKKGIKQMSVRITPDSPAVSADESGMRSFLEIDDWDFKFSKAKADTGCTINSIKIIWIGKNSCCLLNRGGNNAMRTTGILKKFDRKNFDVDLQRYFYL